MAWRSYSARLRKLSYIITLARLVFGAPEVAFPFNSQVPIAARVGQPYLFHFSASTFASDSTSFVYSLSNQPAWLTVDSATRTLAGTPAQADAGASSFTLTAADKTGAAHMPCTLVVSSDPPPHLEGDIGQQLSATVNLSTSSPPTVTILHSKPFHFQFRQTSFIDILQRQLYYYATLADHTPIPSWITFDEQTLSFKGTAPELSAFPQTWDIDLIASDIAGFGSAIAGFTIAVAQQQLVFVPERQTLNIITGMTVQFTRLQHQLFRNSVEVDARTLSNVEASGLPAWLTFDPASLALMGTVPLNASDSTVMITTRDNLGDSATATVSLVIGASQLFVGSIGTLTAVAGRPFSYRFPDSLFSGQILQLSVTLPASATWLAFDASTRELRGTVPISAITGTMQATLVAKSSIPPATQTQAFDIDVKGITTASVSFSVASPSTSSAVSTGAPSQSAISSAASGRRRRLSDGIIVAIVIIGALAVIFILACFVLYRNRRKKRSDENHSLNPTRRVISRPVLRTNREATRAASDSCVDIERLSLTSRRDEKDVMTAPQIALTLPSESTKRKSRRVNRFSYISRASSLGRGERAVLADLNIPEWGRPTEAFHAPHASFSVPAEMAMSSKNLSASASKHAAKRRENRFGSRPSRSRDFGIATYSSAPNNQSSGQGRSRRRGSSTERTAAIDQSSQASLSTRGTSLLSTKPSDFPRPPTESTYTLPGSLPIMSATDAGPRRSIRLVDRSNSTADHRTLPDKRQSYIHNRASTGLQSPLFSHGSRASVLKLSGADPKQSSSVSSTAQQTRNSKNTIATRGNSSSTKPTRQDSRRFSERVKTTFAPNYPRAVTISLAGADDESPAEDDDSQTWATMTEEEDIAAQMALPRHQRSWVRPGEASPTPPPAPLTSQRPSNARRGTPIRGTPPMSEDRLVPRSSSRREINVPGAEAQPPPSRGKAQAHASRLSETGSLVSMDSMSRAKQERPRLVDTKCMRPVSVEAEKRLSSLRAETGTETDTQAGSEMWEDIEGSGSMPPSAPEEAKTKTKPQTSQRSDFSGPAFL